ncbi:MAG: single-stranded-DNA-specific exonuclease RecJ [Nitrospirae bacterium]|nr:single-stranded-DNA-specific exonuclease RecJ [Nitrospirota bacterium]MDA1304224.1 single-stranded-DNA-specific exonuclease RecJ [Nitrospirota bacterium]
MMEKHWITRPVDQEQVLALATAMSLSPITATVLWGRGVRDSVHARQWLSDSGGPGHDPFLLPDMEKSVDRLHDAIQQGDRICFYGDYDVDGISATSLHLSFFRSLGAQAEVYIPHRQEEGYGLNENAIQKLADRKISVMVTADCGTTSHREIALAQRLGLDVIVTDHHQFQDEVPEPFAFINPYRADNLYPFQGLCSGGLAYKVVEAYHRKYGSGDVAPVDGLDLVALSTVADVVPLRDENRAFVREGLRQLTEGTRCGIRALKQVLGITESCTASTIGFRLAPVINAAGRLAHADLGVRLLTSTSDAEALALAQKLEQLNRQRREIEQEIFEEAKVCVEEAGESPVIVVGKRGWHLGVVGIVASRLVERYHRPAVVVAFDEDGIGKGSARSVPGYNVFDALAQCQEHLLAFGGHPAAAGLTVSSQAFSSLQRMMSEVATKNMSDDSKIPVLDIDADVQLSELQPRLLKEFDSLDPFGMGNPEPTLSATGVTVLEKRIVGDNHLKLVVRQNGSVPIECIGFRMGGWLPKINGGGLQFDVAFMPEINRWKGYDRIQLRMRDLRLSRGS